MKLKPNDCFSSWSLVMGCERGWYCGKAIQWIRYTNRYMMCTIRTIGEMTFNHQTFRYQWESYKIHPLKDEFWFGLGRLSTPSDRWISVHGGWLCFGDRMMYVIGCLSKSQHGSRSTRFPFNPRNEYDLQDGNVYMTWHDMWDDHNDVMSTCQGPCHWWH